MCIRDRVDVADIFSVDVTPLASISTSSMDVTSCPDMSVDPGASIRNPSSLDMAGTYLPIRNPSLAPNVGHASLGDTATGTHPLTVPGHTSLGDKASALGRYVH